jgi:hypothetical protein
MDSTNVVSIDYQRRWLVTPSGILNSLNYEGTGIKTTSDLYQNDFLVRVADQEKFIEESYGTSRVWWSGHTIDCTVDTPVTLGDLVYLEPTSGIWQVVDFISARGSKMLGICVGDGAVLLDGHVTVTVNSSTTDYPFLNGSSPWVGNPIYGDSTAAGQMSNAVPTTTGDYVRILDIFITPLRLILITLLCCLDHLMIG